MTDKSRHRILLWHFITFQVLLLGDFRRYTCVASSIPHLDYLDPESFEDEFGNSVDGDSNIVYASVDPKTENYLSGKDDGNMPDESSFYEISESMVDTSFQGDYPYDLVMEVKNGFSGFDFDTGKEYALANIGYVAALVVGVLFLVVVPIASCCYCCCRCSGRCGGRRVINAPEEAGYEDTCGRTGALFMLFIPVVLALVGTGMMFQANDNLSHAIDGIKKGEIDKVDDVETFLENLIKEARTMVGGNCNFTIQVLERDLNNIGFLVGQPMKQSIQPNLDTTFDDAVKLEADAFKIISYLQNLKDRKTTMIAKSNAVQADFSASAFRTNLQAIVDTGSFPDGQTFIDNMESYDASKMPDDTSTITSLDNSIGSGMTDKIQESAKTVDEIPFRVQNETKARSKDVFEKLADYQKKVEDYVVEVETVTDDALEQINFEDFKNKSEDYVDTIRKYEKYRWYGGLALASVFILIESFLLFSCLCGTFGSSASVDPTERSRMSNCGGRLLFTGVLLTFIFGWILMLLTMVLFAIGAPLDAIVCAPVKDLPILDKLIEDYALLGENSGNGTWLGDKVFPDKGVDLQISRVMSDCKDGGAIYEVLKLKEAGVVDLDKVINFKQSVNISDELASYSLDFSAYSFDISSMDSFFDEAAKVEDNVDLDNHTKSLDESPVTVLFDFETTLVGTISSTTNAALLSSLQRLKKDYDAFTTLNSVRELESEVSAMRADLVELEKLINGPPATLKTRCDAFKNSINSANTELPKEIEEAFKATVNNYAIRMTKVLENLADTLKTSITQEFGQCTPVWNIFNDLFVKDVCTHLIGALNAWWFAMGWTLFFLTFIMFVSCYASKHMYRMRYDEDDDDLGALPSSPPVHHGLTSKTSHIHHFNNKVYHADGIGTASSRQLNAGHKK